MAKVDMYMSFPCFNYICMSPLRVWMGTDVMDRGRYKNASMDVLSRVIDHPFQVNQQKD